MSIEAMKQAREALALLDYLWYQSAHMNPRVVERKMYAAMSTLGTAIEQAEKQQLVAWLYVNADMPTNRQLEWTETRDGYAGNWVKYPLYAAPQSISKGKEKA